MGLLKILNELFSDVIHLSVFIFRSISRYKNFRATATNCPNLLTFEGDDCVFGLNFSNLDEADNFKYHLNKRYEQEQKSRKNTNDIFLHLIAFLFFSFEYIVIFEKY